MIQTLIYSIEKEDEIFQRKVKESLEEYNNSSNKISSNKKEFLKEISKW